VTVNLQRAVRQGNYFWDELAANNSGSSLYLSLTNLAVLNNGTNADIIATNIGNVFLPQTPEVFGYDADGNMTNSGRWTITWDAENRAISFASLASAPLASQKKVDCTYDFQGRRIQKIVSTSSGSAWIPISTNRFVYDGWNLIAILNPQSAVVQSYTWGNDLSETQQGAGGVGGLLGVNYQGNVPTNCVPAFDGNGNLAALVNVANGSILASYEYGPFGEVIRCTGPMAKANPIRFSTKYDDDETGLCYYGYRYYGPGTGRWLSRDPVQESSGFNIYSYVEDASVNSVDFLGLQQNFGFPGAPYFGQDVATYVEENLALQNSGYGYSQALLGWPFNVVRPPVPTSSNPGSATDYGWKWLYGYAPEATFGQDSQWTKEMQKSKVVKLDRKRMVDALNTYCSCYKFPLLTAANDSVVVPLAGELSEITPLKYAFWQFPHDMVLNSTAAFIGSFSQGNMTATKISCVGKTANVHFHAINISGWSSATHLPPIGGGYGASILPDNFFGPFGYGHNTTQTFDWDEELSF
jgi:RHS repeat-associated protein